MSSNNSNNWITDPEYIELLKYLIERTKDTVSPLCISQLAREFKERSGALQTVQCLSERIQRLRPRIHKINQIDTDTKVKLLFALRAPINFHFLECLRNRAEVILDINNRIIKYRKYGVGLELGGTHIIRNEWGRLNERGEIMIEFLAQKAIETDTPITDIDFVRDFKEATGATEHISHLKNRYHFLKSNIHESTYFDQKIKIRMIFVSSASVPINFLEILQKDALVEVDESNRITKYTAYDGSLELQGAHSYSAKARARKIEESYLQLITDYFKNRNANNDEMSNLIRFVTARCENVGSPINFWQMAIEFNTSFKTPTSLQTTYNRIKAYCREIQRIKYLDTPTKVKQLFVLGALLNFEFLEGLRKEAFVEVDDQNRITKYITNDASLTLKGRRSRDPNSEFSKKKHWKNVDAMAGGFDKKSDKEGLDDDGVEYLKIEFDSEFESDDEYDLYETEEYTNPSTEPNNYEQRSKNRQKSEIVATGSEKISKKRSLKVSPSPQKASSSGKRAPISKKSADSSKWMEHLETDELEDYDPSFDDLQEPEVKLEPFRRSLIDDFTPFDPEDEIKVIPSLELREPKKEVEEELIKNETMELPVKTEEDFIILKQEELEEGDIKPELFY